MPVSCLFFQACLTGYLVRQQGLDFLIAPQLRRSIVTFCQESACMASLKVRVLGGKTTVCSIYAPHSGKPLQERMEF